MQTEQITLKINNIFENKLFWEKYPEKDEFQSLS